MKHPGGVLRSQGVKLQRNPPREEARGGVILSIYFFFTKIAIKMHPGGVLRSHGCSDPPGEPGGHIVKQNNGDSGPNGGPTGSARKRHGPVAVTHYIIFSGACQVSGPS